MYTIIKHNPLPYSFTVHMMKKMVNNIYNNLQGNTLLLVEHIPVYTAGYITYNHWKNKYGNTIADIPLIETERGGQITYHGYEQRMCYFMINLKKFYGNIDIKKFLHDIHQLIIDTLAEFSIQSFQDKDYVGIWTKENNKFMKIAAVGIKISKGISYYGIALNVNTDLQFFDFIEPCGISNSNRGTTSMQSILKIKLPLREIDIILKKKSNFFK